MPRKKNDERLPLVPDPSTPVRMKDGRLRTEMGTPVPTREAIVPEYVWGDVYSPELRPAKTTTEREKLVAESRSGPFVEVDQMEYRPLAQKVTRFQATIRQSGNVLSQQFPQSAVTAAPRDEVGDMGLDDPSPSTSSPNRNFKGTAAMYWEGSRND